MRLGRNALLTEKACSSSLLSKAERSTDQLEHLWGGRSERVKEKTSHSGKICNPSRARFHIRN